MKIKDLILPAIAVAAGSIMLSACKEKSADQQQVVPELATITIGETDATLDTSYPATLEGENDVEIRPQISGFLTKVFIEPGQHVSKGQILFQIDQVSLQAAVDAAVAAVNVAQANVNTATTNANNNKILFDKNIISSAAYQTSVDALNAAKAQLNQANANLISAKKNLSYSSVKAPASGIVGTVDYKEGTLVSPQTLLTILSDNGDVNALFSFNEKDILNMTANGSKSIAQAIKELPAVTLRMANGEIYAHPGKVVSISGVLDRQTGSAQAKAVFPNPDGMLRSGNTGQVLIPNQYNNTIVIPQNATYEVQDMKFCFVVGDSSIVKSRPITIAPENDGKNYIVTSGLNIGDIIVTEGVGVSVKDGMKIQPKK